MKECPEHRTAMWAIEAKAERGDLPVTAAYMGECEGSTVFVTASGHAFEEDSFATTHERWFDEDLRMQPTNAGSVTSTSGGFGIRR